MTERLLPFDPAVIPQETSWDCGPAATQVVLNARGLTRSETDLINLIGTTQNGTDYVGLVADALNTLLADADYISVYLYNDMSTQQQKDQLWVDITHSIDAGYGVVMNWVAPPSNYPVGVKGSPSPAYRGGTVYHYVACMGYDDTPGAKALWIADSGFSPFQYWISFEQAATLIPPKGYTFADTATPAPLAPPAPAAPATDTLFADVSEWQVPVDDSYPYPVLSIRVSDGTYVDRNFAANYAWMRAALDSGRLVFGIIYTYIRPATWQSNADTVRSVIDANGGLHPRVALMLDVESGGNPPGDQSEAINAIYDYLAEYTGNPARVIGYANAGDANNMWQHKPPGLRIIGAGYPTDPHLPGQVAHQYTNGTGYGAPLPQGCPPFGNCDMNSADGLTPQDFAAACGIDTTPGGITMATPQDVLNMFHGTHTDGSPLIGPDGADYRRVDLLADDSTPLDEGPNTTRSIFDEITTLAKILTRTHRGKTLFDMIADLHDQLSSS